MATNKFLSTTELDFDNIKTNLKAFLADQDVLTDYDFEGSNMAVLMDLLAYNTNILAFYLNMVGSEAFLDTAQLRESVNSKAKHLNYLPRSRRSSQAIVTFTITPEDAPDYITIPKNYNVLGAGANGSINFLTDAETTIQRSSTGTYVSSNVNIYEGRLVEEYFTANVVNGEYQNRFILESENLDTNSIDVVVYNSSADNTARTFTAATSLYGLDQDSLKYFIQPYSANQYEIVFGDNVLGKRLDNGNQVYVKYRDTIAANGDGILAFSKSSDIDDYSTITIATQQRSLYGAERESIASIKYNAVRHFETQERGVVASDYISLITENFPEIQSVIVYGGELVNLYGKVIISVKPYGGSEYVTTALKNRIVDFLSTKNITTEPMVVDPVFFYTKIVSNVQYDSSNTTDSLASIRSDVIAALEGLNDTTLAQFGADLRYSTLLSTIDAAHTSIVSNDTKVYMVKRWVPNVNTPVSYTLEFGVESENNGGSYTSSNEPVFTSTNFTYTKNGVDYTAYFQDDGLGNIHIYYTSGGTKILLESTVGSINYTTSEISITATIKGYSGRIDLIVKPKNQHIVVTQNRYITVSGSDITVNFEDVRE